MEEKNLLPFGQKIQVGNYTVIKINKSLTKNQLKALRDNNEIPKEIQSKITRAGIPFIKVEALSQIWNVEFACNLAIYDFIDRALPLAIIAAKTGQQAGTTIADFAHLFSMMFTDTTVFGDTEYYEAKANALHEMIQRKSSAMVDVNNRESEDEAALEELKAREKAKETIEEMKEELKKAEEDGNRE